VAVKRVKPIDMKEIIRALAKVPVRDEWLV